MPNHVYRLSQEDPLNEATEQPTIGQAFATRWLEKHRLPEKYRGHEAMFSQEVADAVNDFVHKHGDEYRPIIRAVAMEAADGNSNSCRKVASPRGIQITANGLLSWPTLVAVAEQYSLRVDESCRFPV